MRGHLVAYDGQRQNDWYLIQQPAMRNPWTHGLCSRQILEEIMFVIFFLHMSLPMKFMVQIK